MATSGRETTQQEQDRIRRLQGRMSVREAAKTERVSPTTVQKIWKQTIAK